jgi:hypothetical protein
MQGIIFFLFLSLGSVILIIFIKNDKTRKASREIKTAARSDLVWEPTKLTERASSLFLAYQEAWCKGDEVWLNTICTPDFAKQSIQRLQLLKSVKRENIMINTRIIRVTPHLAHDDANDESDLLAMRIEASSDNRLIDTTTSTQLIRKDGVFVEYWTFNRIGNDWRIANTRPEIANLPAKNEAVESFSHDNSLYFDPGAGWLMLPSEGELFKKSKLSEIRIENYVFGSCRDKLISIYSAELYLGGPKWLIGQTTTSKSVFDILIRPNKFLQITPFGMKHQTTKIKAFDKVFSVDSDPKDNIDNFELLSPSFMQYMIDLPFEVAIEKVGNNIYFATTGTDKASFADMLQLVEKALSGTK